MRIKSLASLWFTRSCLPFISSFSVLAFTSAQDLLGSSSLWLSHLFSGATISCVNLASYIRPPCLLQAGCLFARPGGPLGSPQLLVLLQHLNFLMQSPWNSQVWTLWGQKWTGHSRVTSYSSQTHFITGLLSLWICATPVISQLWIPTEKSDESLCLSTLRPPAQEPALCVLEATPGWATWTFSSASISPKNRRFFLQAFLISMGSSLAASLGSTALPENREKMFQEHSSHHKASHLMVPVLTRVPFSFKFKGGAGGKQWKRNHVFQLSKTSGRPSDRLFPVTPP